MLAGRKSPAARTTTPRAPQRARERAVANERKRHPRGGAASARSESLTHPGHQKADETEACRVDTKAVRKWAGANGIELSTRGRVPTEVIEKYRAAGN